MKKIFGISLVSVLMSMSMLSGAMAYDYSPLISASPNSYGYITADGSDSSNADGLELGEWKAIWNSYGTAKGTSMCSADGSGYSNGNTISGTPASITNQSAQADCWCKMTSFTEKDNGPTHNDTSLWVFNDTYDSASVCAADCAYNCGDNLRYYSAMRSGIFGSVVQGSGSGGQGSGAEPVAGNASSPTATNAPKYALKGAGTGDGNMANAGYVKGAYNALIKGINKTHEEVNTLNTNIGTYANAVSHLTDGKATQTGTVATIKSATSNETIATSSVNITGVTPSSISATASGNVILTATTMGDWANDTAAANPVQITTSFNGLTVNGLAMSAPSANTATLTKSGIGGTVNVAEYIAQAAAAHYSGYQTLISTNGNSYGYKSADGSGSRNADGLELGEWKVVWDDYGTAKGTSMCSSTGNDNTFSRGSTTTDLTTSGATNSCWCKLTSFTEKGNGPTYNDTSLWVFYRTDSSADSCAKYCATFCGDNVSSFSVMRSGLFGSVQQ